MPARCSSERPSDGSAGGTTERLARLTDVRRSFFVVALILAACGRAGEQTVSPAATTALPERIVSVPATPGADWRLWIRDGVLFATPPGLGIGPATPGGNPGVREASVSNDDGTRTALVIRIWHGPAADTLGHLASKSRPTRSVRLGSHSATELSFGDERSLAVELDERTVLEVAGPPQAFDDNAYAIAALAASLRDSDVTYSRDEVTAAVDAAIKLTGSRVPDPPLSRGATVSYRVDGNEREFAMVMIFEDRRSRLLEDPNEGGGFGATVSWSTRTDYRGLGNVAVFVGSADAAVRYRALRALDGLARRGSEPGCVEDGRAVFRSFVGALGVSSFADVQDRLSSDASMTIADARGILANVTGIRGRPIGETFAAATRSPVIGWTAMRPADVVVDGTRISTPPGTTTSSNAGETALSVNARTVCERGLVRLSDVSISIGPPVTHPCPAPQGQGVMTKGIPVNTATKADVLRLVERDAGAMHTLEDIAGVRQDPNPLRDPRVPRCALERLSFGEPVFARRYPTTAGTWLVPVRFGDLTVLTMWVGRDENGLGQVGGSQGGQQPGMDEAEARRVASAPGDAVRSLELVYAKPLGKGLPDQIAWRIVRSSGAVVYLFPSYPGAGPDGALFREDQVAFR